MTFWWFVTFCCAEITAAIRANVCTYAVMPGVEIDQPVCEYQSTGLWISIYRFVIISASIDRFVIIDRSVCDYFSTGLWLSIDRFVIIDRPVYHHWFQISGSQIWSVWWWTNMVKLIIFTALDGRTLIVILLRFRRATSLTSAAASEAARQRGFSSAHRAHAQCAENTN